MRIGAKLPSSGPLARTEHPGDAASQAEKAGFDSVWVSDHVVMPKELVSRYPFSSDGRVTWDGTDPWFDALISMAMAVAFTTSVEVGVAVLVIPMRNPVILAKQVSSLDALSNGRVVLGVGAGWLKEEFVALNSSFQSRGQRLEEWISIMKECWTGVLTGGEYEHYHLPSAMFSYPTPRRDIPVLVGGMSQSALRRVADSGDGWVAIQEAEKLDPSILGASIRAIREEATRRGRAIPNRNVLRVPGSPELIAPHIGALSEAGVTDVILDVDWTSDLGPRRTLETIRNELAG